MTQTYPPMLAVPTQSVGTLEVFAPFDRSLIATVATVGAEGTDQALSTAHQLFRQRKSWLPKHKRIEILEKTAGLMAQRAEELAIEAAREGGKPLIDSRIEVARAIDSIRICADTLRTEDGHTVPMGVNPASVGKLAFTSREPIGPVVAFSAFNHPLNLICHQAGPAIAAGCPVILKPAEDAPLSCFRFVEIIRQAGLPEEWCQALATDSRELAGQLAADSRVGFLSFIGSAAVGWMLRSKLAPGARCALEHGGVAPVIVAPDADLELLVPKLVKSGFYHAGQVCVSVQRVFAHRSIARTLAEQVAVGAKRQIIGDPTLPETEIGPLIRPGEVQRVDAWVKEAVAEGAEMLVGGEPLSQTCYPCTVLYDPSSDSKVSQKEIFGPVIAVYPFDNIDEAIARANALPYAFQAAVFTQNIDTAMHAYRNLDASAVMINDHTAFRVDWMPFGGLRHSGLGVGGIPYTLRDMQIEKLMVLSSKSLTS